MNKIAYTGEY